MISRGFLWRTAITLAVVLDYFLFATGNPSITYSIFGGWFIVPLLLGALVFIWYGLQSFRTSQGRRVFAYYVVVVFATGTVLLPLSSTARSHAATRLESEVLAFAKDPGTRRVEASDSSRALMTCHEASIHNAARCIYTDVPADRLHDQEQLSGNCDAHSHDEMERRP